MVLNSEERRLLAGQRDETGGHLLLLEGQEKKFPQSKVKWRNWEVGAPYSCFTSRLYWDLGCPPQGQDAGWGPGDGQDFDPHRLENALS